MQSAPRTGCLTWEFAANGLGMHSDVTVARGREPDLVCLEKGEDPDCKLRLHHTVRGLTKASQHGRHK